MLDGTDRKELYVRRDKDETIHMDAASADRQFSCRRRGTMKTEIRRERMKKYGSILYCPAQDCKCFGRDTDEECRHEKCLLQDPEYIALQERIEEKRRARR